MAPPLGRLGSGVKLPVQVRLFPEAIAAVDAFAAELSQQRDGAAFRRAEALRMAALEWLKARQARRVRVTTSQPASAPEAARVVTETVTTVTAPFPPAVPATVAPRPHEAAAAAEEAAMAATPSPPKRPGRARAEHSAHAQGLACTISVRVTPLEPAWATIASPWVVYLPNADKYRRLTRRPSQGQKGLDERALMAS